ncbi:hypothetical protein C8N46_101101 [Kordia periserrulae]|uniref:Uncharacterized protein n=1 Tax=Kordia periserrulae TaxID=701523 RepID=A0A2T6C5B1_9FLAO|nr:hypothetical protein [Kordia periserrulae]PTX63501.1 hypothetical protein C8N46_101101 [Kordia periserrulae]
MKKIVFIICLFFSFKGKAVDAGYAYRFYVNIALNNGETHHGYIYKYSYNEFKIHQTNIIDFLSKQSNGKIKIYPYIIEVNAGRHIIDFIPKGINTQVSLNEIEKLDIIEYVYFTPDERLKELTKEQFQLIKTTKARFEVIEDVHLYENIKFILFTWDENKELSRLKNKTANEIKEQRKRYIETEIIQSEKFTTFMKILKENLLKENILLIEFAEAL